MSHPQAEEVGLCLPGEAGGGGPGGEGQVHCQQLTTSLLLS
jgi:hypothetical protein